MNELRRWERFWKDKTVPLHKTDDESYYARHAEELKLLFQRFNPESVLEIGCGNGALYTYLGFDRVRTYKGIDFSPAMLDEFRKHHPLVSLETTSGHSYNDDHKYDLIFSNGVVQNFDAAMLSQHFRNGGAMLSTHGRLICASVPWRSLRTRYLMGKFNPKRRNLAWSALHLARYWHRDKLGHWYDFREIEDLAGAHGLVAKFYGSLNYPYRFHAVLSVPDAGRSSCQSQVPKRA